jgi:hypothetical protein
VSARPSADAEYGYLLDGARLVVRNGRHWLDLTADDIQRGAVAIIRDPVYRDELVREALRHAEETQPTNVYLACRVLSALTAMELRDLAAGAS